MVYQAPRTACVKLAALRQYLSSGPSRFQFHLQQCWQNMVQTAGEKTTPRSRSCITQLAGDNIYIYICIYSYTLWPLCHWKSTSGKSHHAEMEPLIGMASTVPGGASSGTVTVTCGRLLLFVASARGRILKKKTWTILITQRYDLHSHPVLWVG